MSALSELDWSLVQTFLAVADTGSLSSAARQLGMTQPTVGRHIQTLEQDLQVALFKRQARGMALTAQGEALLGPARAMRDAAKALSLNAAGETSALSGTVRVTASVFASHYFLPPVIADIRDTHPDIQIELVPNDATDNLLFREADIAVRMYRPTQLDIVAKHVGNLDLGLFAAKSYIQRKGRPASGTEVMALDVVGYDHNESLIRGFREAGFEVDRNFFPVRCDNQAVLWELVRAGCGLGFAPAAQGRNDPALEEVDLGIPLPKLEVWLAAHEAVRRSPRVNAVWKLLEQRLAEACTRRSA